MILEFVGKFLGLSSSVLLLAGIVFLMLPERRKKSGLVLVYVALIFTIEVSCNMHAMLYNTQNLYLFSISSYLHFAFLTYVFYHKLLKLSAKVFVPLILLGLVPLYFNLNPEVSIVSFQSFDRSIYSFIIMLYGLFYLYTLMRRQQLQKTKSLRFTISVVLFFSIDALLAVGANFLVNEHLALVAGFWIFRALLLHLYYWSVIYYLWKIGKTHQPLLHG